MKNTKVVAVGFAVLNIVLISAGCGKAGDSGLYSLPETFGGTSGLSTNCQSQTIQLNLVDNSGVVSGGGSNSCFTQNLTGTNSGNGLITGVNLTMTILANSNVGYSGYPTTGYPTTVGYPGYVGSSTTTNCSYTGTLQIVNNTTVSGTLSSTTAQTTSVYVSCPQTITITNGTIVSTN